MIYMKFILAILITFSINTITYAGATSPGDYYVSPGKLNVRLAPSENGEFINKIYKGQKVEVFEVKGEWARISRYYDGVDEEVSGNVARWVSAKYLKSNGPVEVQKINSDYNSNPSSNPIPIPILIRRSQKQYSYQNQKTITFHLEH